MAKRIQLRRDTAANWSSTNPILAQGEIGIDLTNNKLKIGTGTTAWNSLAYWDDKVTDLSNFAGSIIPAADNTYDLGSPTKQWRDIFVSNGSIYIGDIKLSNDSGQLLVQQVTDPGEETEAPVPDTPGVVTTDRLVNGEWTVNLGSDGTLTLPGESQIKPDGGNLSISVGTITLADLENTYIENLQTLADLFEQQSAVPGYPWGITLPVSYLTYDELIELSPGTIPGFDGAALPPTAMAARNAYLIWQEALDEERLMVNVSSRMWEFRGDGKLQLPQGGDILDSTGNSVLGGGGAGDTLTHAASGNTATIGNNTFQLNIDNGDGSDIQYSLNAQGKMTLTPGEESYTDAGVEVIGNTYTIQANTSVSLLTTNSDPNPATANTATFSIGKTGSEINLTRSGESGWIRNWQFKTDGNLQLPVEGDIVDSEGNSVLGGSADQLSNTGETFTLSSDGDVTFSGEAGGINRGVIWDYGAEIEGTNSTIRQDNDGLSVKAWTTYGGGGPTGDNSAPVNIRTNQGENEKWWTFAGDGNLTLPEGGDILDSEGDSVLGGGAASLTDDKEVKITVGNTDYFALISRAQQGDNSGVSPQAVAYDSDGNMITLHVSNYDTGNDKLVISKFSDTGELSWQKQLNNHDVDTSVNADLVTLEDNSMVITFTIDSYGETDRDSIAVMRLDEEGGLVWSKVLTGNVPVEVIESVTPEINTIGEITIESTDYQIVFVANNVTYYDGWVFQESTDEENWTTLGTISLATYDSEANTTSLLFPDGTFAGNLDSPTKSYRVVTEQVNSWHETSCIATDGDDVFVFAEYEDGASGPNLPKSAILKLAGTNGNLIWAKVLEVPGAAVEMYGADVGADGHIVAMGYYVPDVEGQPSGAWVNKFDGTTGEYIWGTAIGGLDMSTSAAGGDVVVDSQNNVFVTLNTREIIMNENSQYVGDQFKTIAYIVKIDSDGSILWSRRAGPGPCASVASGIDCDSTGNVYLSVLTVTQDNAARTIGNFLETGRTTMALAKYSTTGAVLWQRYIESDNYDFIGYDDIEDSDNDYDFNYNRARNLSLGPNGKLAIQGSVLERDSDGEYYSNGEYNGDRYKQGVVLQIDQDGREMTIGSGSDKFTVRASRIPGKFVTLVAEEGIAEGPLSDLTEDVLVVTPTLTFADAELAQVRSTSAAYEYVFGNDGTLSIPNDGDIRLTQTQIGWFSIFGKANNNNDDVWFRANCVDPSTGDVYAVGQEDDDNQGIVVRYNSQGQVVWSIRLYDNDDENSTRCNAVKIHPTNGNIVVLCEYYGNQTGALFLQIDPETARVVVSTGFRDAGEGGDAIPYDFTFDIAGNIIVVGRKWDEYRQISVTPITGSTTSTLIINKATVTEGPLPISNSWYMYGTGITGRTTIQYVNRYTGLTGTVNQGIGAGFQIDIDYSNTTDYNGAGYYNLVGGSNYSVGDVITIAGTSLGGTSPTNDMTVTVQNVDGSGAVTDFLRSGTAQDTTVKIQIVEAVNFGGSGSWTVAYALGGEAFIYKADDEFGYVWSKVLSAGNANDTERYLSVAVGSDNAIYAAGEMVARNNVAGADLNSYWCAVVSKFAADGTHAWTKALNTTLNDSYAKCVSVQGTNTVVVSHEQTGNGSTVITKLDAAGNVKWQRETYSGDDSSVAVDTNGDVYAVIEAQFENRYEDCIKLIKFNAAGEIVYRKFFGTLLYDYSGTREFFKNGRNLTLDTDNLYISGYTTAFDDDYDNSFLVKLPKDASCEGSYSGWVLQNDIYDVVKVTATEATTFTPVVGTGEFENWTPDFATNWYDPSSNGELHTLAEIVDRDGGAIEFADGTRQTSSAQQIPQRKIFNGADHRLQPEDSGRHIFVTNSDTDIIVPYNEDSPLPIGFTVVVINDSGGTMNIDADGGGINIRNSSDGNSGTYWDLAGYGMATLIKVDTNYWYISGNVSED